MRRRMTDSERFTTNFKKALDVVYVAIWTSIMANVIYDLLKIYVLHLMKTHK